MALALHAAVLGSLPPLRLSPGAHAPVSARQPAVMAARVLPASSRSDGAPPDEAAGPTPLGTRPAAAAPAAAAASGTLLSTQVSPDLSGLQSAEAPGGRSSITALPYYPNTTLDRPAVPYSEPDWSRLDGVSASGLPLRLRVLVNAHGDVDAVWAEQASPDDSALVERLQAAWLATRYIPGRQAGTDVPAAIELLIEPSAPLLP